MMIQQITEAQLPFPAQQQSAQTQKPDQDFESVLKQSVGRLVRKPADKSAKTGQPESDTAGKKTDSVSPASDDAASAALSAAVFRPAQEISVQNVPQAPAQTAGDQAITALSASSTASSAPTMRTAASLFPNADVSGKILPTVQQRVFPFAGQTGAPVKEQAGANPSNRATVPTAAKAFDPAAVPDTAQQTIPASLGETAQAAVPQAADAADQPKQNAQVVPQAADGAQPAVQSGIPKPAAQTYSGNSQSGLETGGQSAAQEIKQEKGSDQTASSDQKALSFPELMQTGNVVIKISDAASDTAKPVSRQIADQVTMQIKAGNPQFEMELNPKELGKVTVKIAMQDGALTVEIAAADPKTQSMLLSNAGDIRSLLETTVNHPVQVLQAPQDSQSYQQNQDSSNAQQQEQQQRPHFAYQADGDDSEGGPEDFLTLIQQLRVQASMA